MSFDSLASFHSLNVDCCVLQHPSTVKPHDLVGRHKVVSVFCENGLPGVHALTATAVACNSHRSRSSGVDLFGVANR